MRRVDASGAGFLYGETSGWHMHVGALMLVDPTDAPGLSFEAMQRVYAERLARVPNLRSRLVSVPFGLDRPALADDADFDVAAQCHRATLPAPGTRRQLADLLGELIARKLDRRRPLWEVWWIDGLEDGRVAMFVKLHHALVDGVSGMALAALVMDTEPEPAPEPEVPTSPVLPGPSGARLGVGAICSLAALPWRATRFANQVAHQTATLVRHARLPQPPPLMFSAPRSAFNVPIGPDRRVALCSLPMSDVLEVKRAFGVSVNDVLLAVVGGALRGHLEDRGELPVSPLVAQVPVAARTAATTDDMGTQVVNMLTTLGTHVAGSAERLELITSVTARAKEYQHAIFADRALALPDVVPPFVISLAAQALTGLGLERHLPPFYNAIVSDVRGSPVDLYVVGARVEAICPFGPLLLGSGLNITALSHLDTMHVGILATPEAVPDPWDLVGRMGDELARLRDAARAPG